MLSIYIKLPIYKTKYNNLHMLNEFSFLKSRLDVWKSVYETLQPSAVVFFQVVGATEICHDDGYSFKSCGGVKYCCGYDKCW